jgi:(2Fe-2S) ferredoxin
VWDRRGSRRIIYRKVTPEVLKRVVSFRHEVALIKNNVLKERRRS